jgi:WD40 repeat protein
MKWTIYLLTILVVSPFLIIGTPTSGIAAQESRIYHFAWSPDGSRIAVARSGGIAQVLDAATLQVLVTLQHSQVSVLAWSPDGARLASGGWDDTIRIWDADTGQSLAVIDSLVDLVTSIELTSDGRRLIASGFETGYRIWNASTYEFVNSFMGGQYEIDLSPDNTRLAEARGGGVGIVNVETGETIARLEGHQREVMSVAWSPDGTNLSAAVTTEPCIWDTTTYQRSMVLQALK